MKKNTSLWTIDKELVLGAVFVLFASVFGLLIPLFLRKIIDIGSQLTAVDVIQLIALFLVNALLLSLGNYIMARSGERQVKDIRLNLMNHLYHYPMSFFHHQKSGELASRIVNDTLAIRDFLIDSIPSFVASVVTLLGSIGILFYLDWKLALVLFLGLPAMLLFVIPLSKMGEKSASHLQEETSRLTGDLTESFQEIEMIKVNTAEHLIIKRQGKLAKNIQCYALKNDLLNSFESPFALLFIFGIMALIFLYGGQRVVEGSLSIGTLISFLVYLLQLLNPVGALSAILTAYAKQKGATATLQELLSQAEEDILGEQDIPQGDLLLEDLSFAYEEGKPVLEKIDLQLKKGQKTAIVGPSGSGKTTLINLLARFYAAQSGRIRLDGQDIQHFHLLDWRKKIALVAQSNAILSGSIRENLCFGIEKDMTDTELWEALEKANLSEDVAKMTSGLESPVGERGKLLSGGQKQRLQIARAYLKKPDVILFDEATANLDADAEYEVSKSLNALVKDRIVVVIAHRLSTVVDADQIYFLENHRITGQGSHQELLAQHQTYARFVQEQML